MDWTPPSVRVVDEPFHFGTPMPPRVGASIPWLGAEFSSIAISKSKQSTRSEDVAASRAQISSSPVSGPSANTKSQPTISIEVHGDQHAPCRGVTTEASARFAATDPVHHSQRAATHEENPHGDALKHFAGGSARSGRASRQAVRASARQVLQRCLPTYAVLHLVARGCGAAQIGGALASPRFHLDRWLIALRPASQPNRCRNSSRHSPR